MTHDSAKHSSRPMWRRRGKTTAALASLLAFAGVVAAGCGGGRSGGGGGSGTKIALLLPENQTARYESHDRPDFEKRVKQRAPSCVLPRALRSSRQRPVPCRS